MGDSECETQRQPIKENKKERYTRREQLLSDVGASDDAHYSVMHIALNNIECVKDEWRHRTIATYNNDNTTTKTEKKTLYHTCIRLKVFFYTMYTRNRVNPHLANRD